MLEGSFRPASAQSTAPPSTTSSVGAPVGSTSPPPGQGSSAKMPGPSFTAINGPSPPPTTSNRPSSPVSTHTAPPDSYAQPRPPTASSASGAKIELVSPRSSEGRDERRPSYETVASVNTLANASTSVAAPPMTASPPAPPTWSASYTANDGGVGSSVVPPQTGGGAMLGSAPTSTAPAKPKKKPAGSACNSCHRLKTRCSGGHPCDRCASHNVTCEFDRSLVFRSPVASTGPLGSSSRKSGARAASGLATAASVVDEDDEIENGVGEDDEAADDASSNGAAAAVPKKRKTKRPRTSISAPSTDPAAGPSSSPHPSQYPQQYPPTYPPSLLHAGSPPPHSSMYGSSINRGSAAFHAQHANLALQGPAAMVPTHSPSVYGHHLPQHMPPPAVPYGPPHYRRHSSAVPAPEPMTSPTPSSSSQNKAVEDRLASLEKSVSTLLGMLEKKEGAAAAGDDEDLRAKKKARVEEPKSGIADMTLPPLAEPARQSQAVVSREDDPIRLGIVSELDARESFKNFSLRCLPFLRLLGTSTFDDVLTSSPLLLTAILSIDHRFRHPRKSATTSLASLTSRLVGQTFFDSLALTAQQLLDAARACLFLACWPLEPAETHLEVFGVTKKGQSHTGWALAGHATRLAFWARGQRSVLGNSALVGAIDAVLLAAEAVEVLVVPTCLRLQAPNATDEGNARSQSIGQSRALWHLSLLYSQIPDATATSESRAKAVQNVESWSKEWTWSGSRHLSDLGAAVRPLRLLSDALLLAYFVGQSGPKTAEDARRASTTAMASIHSFRDDAREGGLLAYAPDFVKDTLPLAATSLLELVRPEPGASSVEPAVATHFVRMAHEILQGFPNGEGDRAAEKLQLLAAQKGLKDFEALGALQSLSGSGMA